MSDVWLLPVAVYLVDSIFSGMYAQSFLKEKFEKKLVLIGWGTLYFCIQIVVFEVWDGFPAGEAVGIILNIFILLFMQLLFFQKDMQKQLFVAFSFVAGKEIVKYMFSVFSFILDELCSNILNYLAAKEIIRDFGKSFLWVKIYTIVNLGLSFLLYVLLLFVYLRFISKKFLKKDYLLQTHENVFLILPCVAALCISVVIKKMVVSVENGGAAIMYDAIPEIKFWIPVICILLLCTIIASVVLFQKLVQYNEEAGKRILLENQVQQMQKEITEIQDIYADMRGLRHDMRSHLTNIALLIKDTVSPAKQELESYIGKMEETVKKLDFTYQTGNPITDIIIHQREQEAEKRQIQFRVDFAYPAKLSIDVYDIAVILNNALENAIEACCKVEGEKQIKLRSYVKGSLFFMEVENDFSNAIILEKESGLPVSSKKDGKLHGIGMSNMKRCAKKYMGDIDIAISDTEGRRKFSLTVMMNGKVTTAKTVTDC